MRKGAIKNLAIILLVLGALAVIGFIFARIMGLLS